MSTDASRAARTTAPTYRNVTRSMRVASAFLGFFASTTLLGGLLGLFDAHASHGSKSTRWAGLPAATQVAAAPSI